MTWILCALTTHSIYSPAHTPTALDPFYNEIYSEMMETDAENSFAHRTFG